MQTIRYIFSDGTTSEIEVTDELYISIYENVLQYLFRLVQTLSLLARHQKRTAKKLAVLFWYNKESRRRQKGGKDFCCGEAEIHVDVYYTGVRRVNILQIV